MGKKINTTHCRRYGLRHLYILLLVFAIPFIVVAGKLPPTSDQDTVMSIYSHRTFSFSMELFFGLGMKNHVLAKTTDDKDVSLSGGGGIGGLLTAMYNINPSMELGVSIGSQSSSLSPKVENGEGKFPRRMFLLTYKYDLPIQDALLKFGGGVGLYLPGDFDVDMSKITSGAHNVYSYDNSAGFHILVDYERLISPQWSWGAGIRYYNVSYKLKSATSNGINVPINSLPSSITGEIGTLDGGTFNLSVFVAYHLY